jgi:hypothetical protein
MRRIEREEMIGVVTHGVDPAKGSLCNPATDLPNYMKFSNIVARYV